MEQIKEWFSKWWFVIFLGILAVGLLFTLGCGIFTAFTNLAVGLVAIVFSLGCLAFIIGWMCIEISNG